MQHRLRVLAVEQCAQLLARTENLGHVLVCDWTQLPLTAPVVTVSETAPHASLAVALPSAASIAVEDGLHPSVNDVPVVVIAGGVGFDDQIAVLDVVAVLPHISVAVQVLV